MKRIFTALLFLLPVSASALTNSEIVNEAISKAQKDWFPSAVEITRTYEFKFFPGGEDTEYSRQGSVCGKVDVSSSGKSATVIVVSDVEEVSGNAVMATPSLYDIERDPGPARSALSKKCKSPR